MRAYPGEEYDDVLAAEARHDIAKAEKRLAAAVIELRAAIHDLNGSGYSPALDARAFDDFVHDELGTEYLAPSQPSQAAA